MDSAFAASSFGASGSRIGTSRTPVSGYGGRRTGDKTEETGGGIYEQLYASGVRSMGDAYVALVGAGYSGYALDGG